MVEHTSASVVPLHQVPKKRPKTPRERSQAYRDRKKAALAKRLSLTAAPDPQPLGYGLAHEVVPANRATVTSPVTASRPPVTAVLLGTAALALAGVGIAINGWFARSLGSTEAAGWLFLAVGVAADSAALCLPSCAARLWQAHQRAAAASAWGIFAATLAFAVIASLGFGAENVADVTFTRASRVTLAVTEAQNALSDAMAARDRECKGGVGRFCRERETAVDSRRQALDAAQSHVQAASDPQTEAAARLAAWASLGTLHPQASDVAMLRLLLLALLPQLGGLMLMLATAACPAGRSQRS